MSPFLTSKENNLQRGADDRRNRSDFGDRAEGRPFLADGVGYRGVARPQDHERRADILHRAGTRVAP
jgi:hypothetical protein